MSGAAEQLAPESRSCRIDTRFSFAELALVEKVAGWRGLPPSAFVRGAALAAAKRAEGHGHDDDAALQPAPTALTASQITVIDTARVEVKRVGVTLNQLTRLGQQRELDLGGLAAVVHELAQHYEHMVDALGGKGQP